MTLHHTALSFALSALALTACAQTAPASSHDEHHPAAAANASAPDPMSAMDKQIKAMEEMHTKMLNAKTPQERQALMADQQKLMQEGMQLMNQMRAPSASNGMGGMMMSGDGKSGGMCGGAGGGGGCGMKGGMQQQQQMLEKRMEMMKSMMQMMMDRMQEMPANR